MADRLTELTELTQFLPKMLTGQELMGALTVLPEYNSEIVNSDGPERLMALTDLYRIYIPGQMSVEIYSKLYISLMRSLQKKGTKLAVLQQLENRKAIQGLEYRGLVGGSDSFTIIGASGIGKSSAIERSVSLITGDKPVITTEVPFCQVIPCLTVQCPYDCSVKGMLLEILRKTDETIGTRYHDDAIRTRATTDMLVGSVSQVCLHHVGLLIVDEIQNVVTSRNGRSLVGMLTQLINTSGISICMVGTPESAVFFEQAMQLARRSLGLSYGAMPYGDFFEELCQLLLSYRYVRVAPQVTEMLLSWLYEHTGGVMALLVALIHDAQEIAIMTGTERLDLQSLEEAYRQRLTMMHGYLQTTSLPQCSTTKKKQAEVPAFPSTGVAAVADVSYEGKISSLVQQAKNYSLDVASLLKQHGLLEEVQIS